jgi:hypothetical protein
MCSNNIRYIGIKFKFLMKKSFIVNVFVWFFWLKRVLDRGPEHRESKINVLCLLIIIILIS